MHLEHVKYSLGIATSNCMVSLSYSSTVHVGSGTPFILCFCAYSSIGLLASTRRLNLSYALFLYSIYYKYFFFFIQRKSLGLLLLSFLIDGRLRLSQLCEIYFCNNFKLCSKCYVLTTRFKQID